MLRCASGDAKELAIVMVPYCSFMQWHDPPFHHANLKSWQVYRMSMEFWKVATLTSSTKRGWHVLGSRTKNQPKETVFETDVLQTSWGHSRGRTGSKLWSGPSKPSENKHVGAGIHDPKARTSTTPRAFQIKLQSEKLRAESSFLVRADFWWEAMGMR